MTLEELNSIDEFAELTHYDGNDMTVSVPEPAPGYSRCTAMTTSEANEFLSKGAIPQYVEKHTADDGAVGYEVAFSIAE